VPWGSGAASTEVCGVAGIVDFSGPVDPGIVGAMCDAMVHRGPDSGGLHHEDGVCLGSRRLAIIDVAGGDQPICNEDGSIVVVMNGEIYNHNQLRAVLLRRGHAMSSHVDTEVIAHLYEEYGDDLVHRLHGMYAFALWDRDRRRLLCARDRVGKKPLFWYGEGPRVTVASEMWALFQDPRIERRIEPRAIEAFLAYQYVPHPLSAIRGVQKLPPGGRLVVDANGARVDRYWQLDYTRKHRGISIEDAAERTRELVLESTRRRLMSEVPLGAFLSGGVDSSVVVACMASLSSAPVKTFSIGFDEPEFDEVSYARLVAERYGTDHHEFVVRPQALEIMPRMARHYGEPYADPSAIPSFHLAELAGRHVTVALNGDGGDESFGGYGRYGRGQRLHPLQRLPLSVRSALAAVAHPASIGAAHGTKRARAKRLLRGVADHPAMVYSTTISAFDAEARARLLRPEFFGPAAGAPEAALRQIWDQVPATDVLDRMMGVDINTYLPDDLLVKMDIATMAASVEARSPLLDQELMQFAAALPVCLKRDGKDSKICLKAAFADMLPPPVLQRRKMGFGVPLARWFREELASLPSELLLDESSLSHECFSRAEVERLIGEHAAGTADNSQQLWTLCQLEMWHREVVRAPRERPAHGRRRDGWDR
jgi:asparagine synthase (glutamine-hydrolysing)